MYKEEMIQIHQFLVYLLKYLEKDENIQGYCQEYISLNISPHHIHKTKAEHKHAIFILSHTIAEVLNNSETKGIPDNVTRSLGELIKKSQNELKM